MIDPHILPFTAPQIHKVAGELVGPTKGIATRTIEKLQVKFRKGFGAYTAKQLARASTVKTIISSNAPIPPQDLYVNLFLASGNTAARDEDFLKSIDRYRAIVFTATAGAGKSMLMRYLYIRFLEAERDRLPIFIELRDLNQNPNQTTMSFIRSRIADYIEDFSDQQLRYAFEQGKVLLFLDGFDEIDHDVRKDRERELNQIAARYDRLQIFVSSRPAEGFANWEKFHVFNVQPFTEKQVELLLSKIPYDQEIKKLFKKKLEEGLYRTHNEFLTNPLLTIMMLVTLEQFAEVPAKIHLFYEYAFEALFGRHDVTKGGFQRKRHTSLALDDFKRLFSYFCTITYIRKSLSFSSDALLNYIQQSIASSQIQVDKSLFKNDLTESTCMLVLDGLDYTFSHRSFQEYFTAYFLARVKVDEIERVVPKLVEISGPFDNVLKMLSEMNNEKFEEAWSLPALQLLTGCCKDIDADNHPLAFCEAVMGPAKLNIIGDQFIQVLMTATYNHQVRFALYNIYGLFAKIQGRLKGQRELDGTLIRRIRSGELLAHDPRFEHVRKAGQIGQLEIKFKPSDEEWFRETYFGRFLLEESKLLPQLTEEVAGRVNARKVGFAEIFP
jgi:hypothetical protein